jgi:hypothetical protein
MLLLLPYKISHDRPNWKRVRFYFLTGILTHLRFLGQDRMWIGIYLPTLQRRPGRCEPQAPPDVLKCNNLYGVISQKA